jgi:EAL domain-containing protein (putative c-di-GMP-specific phosphodiesterase class I)/CheY-like chemotaxis protein
MIVDDNAVIVAALRGMFRSRSDMEVVGVASDPDSAGEVAARERPDVALVDVMMPKGGGLRAARILRAVSSRTSVLILSGAHDSNVVLEMLREGAVGYIAKPLQSDALFQAVGAAAQGIPFLSGDIAATLIHEIRRTDLFTEEERARETEAIETLLVDDSVSCVFQPIVSLDSREVEGYEALTRFDDGSPVGWFARAWLTGHGPELETRSIERALESFTRIPDEVYLSLNLSPETLKYRRVRELVDQVDPRRLVFEVTEHAQIEDMSAFEKALSVYRRLGVRFAVDDCGSGFGNFVRMLEVVPDIIKLDRVIVEGIDHIRVKAVIAESLISLAKGIGADLVGEGVETPAEADTLDSIGVKLGQGYLFGRPSALPRALA